MWACEPDCSAQGSQKRELDACSWGHRHCEPLHRVQEPELTVNSQMLSHLSRLCIPNHPPKLQLPRVYLVSRCEIISIFKHMHTVIPLGSSETISHEFLWK